MRDQFDAGTLKRAGKVHFAIRCLASLVALSLSSLVSAVPQASVVPRPIRLPVVDGTDIRFTRLSTADGLSQTKVAQIVEDDQGFMWFGTQYGLNRYDGYNFKVFVHDTGNPNRLSGVSSLARNKDPEANS